MELDEAIETLNKAGFIVEDKYMDDMENELDQTISLNNILDTIKKLYKKCGIKRDVIYVWPVEENERYCVGIEPNKYISIHRPYDFLCFILDREKRTYKMEWGYSITKDDEYSYSPCISPVPVFDGPVKDILKPGEKTLTKLNKPGLFKRIFGKKKVQESYKNEIPDDVMELDEAQKILTKNGYLMETRTNTRFARQTFKDKPIKEKPIKNKPTNTYCVIFIHDKVNNWWNGGYKGYVGEGNSFVAEPNEAKIFNINDKKSIRKAAIGCLENAILEDDPEDPVSEVYAVPLIDGKPNFKEIVYIL